MYVQGVAFSLFPTFFVAHVCTNSVVFPCRQRGSSTERPLAVYVQYVLGHLGTCEEEEKGDWMDNKSCCSTEQRRRDERGVDTPRRAQPRQAE